MRTPLVGGALLERGRLNHSVREVVSDLPPQILSFLVGRNYERVRSPHFVLPLQKTIIGDVVSVKQRAVSLRCARTIGT